MDEDEECPECPKCLECLECPELDMDGVKGRDWYSRGQVGFMPGLSRGIDEVLEGMELREVERGRSRERRED